MTRMSSLRLFLLLGIRPFLHLLIDQIILHFMLFFTVFVLSLYSDLIIFLFISIFNFSPYSIYLHCMNIIYLSPNITLLYHIQNFSAFHYTPHMDFTLYFKYTLYLIYPHRVNIFHLSSNFDLLPYSYFIYLISKLTFKFGVFST